MPEKNIWTIGHSTHTLKDFVAMLHSFQINRLVDIRNFPGSRKFPHFNKEDLQISLPENGIAYTHIKELGGRRKPKADSKNDGWRLPAFRGYADYMETKIFKNAIKELEQLGAESKVAYMCSEAVWWSCHRSLVSDYLKLNGWTVQHIMGIGKSTEHPYTSPAKIVGGRLLYTKE